MPTLEDNYNNPKHRNPEREERTKAHIQIKGNEQAVKKMLEAIEKIEDLGVEVRLTIEKSR